MLSHIADVLFEPLFAGLVLLVLSYVLAKRAPRFAFFLPGAAFGVLLVFSLPSVANGLQRGLEQPVLTTMKPGVTYDAVILLGGAVNATLTDETGMIAVNESAERLLTTFDLLRTNRAKNAIVSGGLWPNTAPGVEPESRITARQLEAWGIDPSRIAVDELSKNTHENAVESVRIARERGWTRDVLVTSAAHMARARGCFAREGFPLDTLSVDFSSYDPSKTTPDFLPRAGALAQSTYAIRERVGRVVYRLRGWSE